MATQKAQILLPHCLTNLWFQANHLLPLYSVPAPEKWVVRLEKLKHHKVHGSVCPLRNSMLMVYISVTFRICPLTLCHTLSILMTHM